MFFPLQCQCNISKTAFFWRNGLVTIQWNLQGPLHSKEDSLKLSLFAFACQDSADSGEEWFSTENSEKVPPEPNLSLLLSGLHSVKKSPTAVHRSRHGFIWCDNLKLHSTRWKCWSWCVFLSGGKFEASISPWIHLTQPLWLENAQLSCHYLSGIHLHLNASLFKQN